MNIAKDNVVAKIQGMDPVWISVAVPESIAWLLKDASQFRFRYPPGRENLPHQQMDPSPQRR
jgi:Cu(I)/Ag(I) efflux system membrane fusion protein